MTEQSNTIPKVSVLVVTHNHAAYLAQALDSIVTQQVSFPFEVIVGEDGSTDGTRLIVEDYHRRYPHLIRPLYNAHNQGAGANVQACFQACRGQYLALLEGDDYWTDPHKLQTQVDWLDAHPDFTICFHRYGEHIEQAGQPDRLVSPSPTIGPGEQTVFGLADVLGYTPPHVSSVVLRQVLPALPEWLFTVYPIDAPLLALYAGHGKVKLLPGVRSMYRVHQGGSWTSMAQPRRRQHLVHMYQQLRRHYAATPHEALMAQIYNKMYLDRAGECVAAGELAEARRYMRHFWATDTDYRSKLPLLKSLGGVTLRLARGYATRAFSHLRGHRAAH